MAEIKDCCSCIYATRSTFCDICVACGVEFKNYTAKPKRKKRKTHFDEVRAMKVKELAEWLYAHKWNNPDSALAWLKQEIAEEK